MFQLAHKVVIRAAFLSGFCIATSLVGVAQNADKILENYRVHLTVLPLAKQEHFALRMYRMTGDNKYLSPIIASIWVLSHEYKALLVQLSHPETLVQKANDLLQTQSNLAEKYKIRAQKTAQYGDLYLYLYLLEMVNKIYSYHLEKTSLFPQIEWTKAVLKKQSPRLKIFILDKDVIKMYSAQLINYINYLDDLHLMHLKTSYTLKFQEVFPDSLDGQLSVLDYEAKIYGMTHFITAASHYYQHLVDEHEYLWIGDYFESHINEILKKTENDVIAEVGVCLLLLNRPNSMALRKIKAHLNQVYDKQNKMIPNTKHSTDFIYGEHRNILTIMLFNWPKKLVAGPFFDEQSI